jgi:two-component system, response regulator
MANPVLLVDDNLADAQLTLEAFREFGATIEIVHVRDGAEALSYLRQPDQTLARTTPSVVFLDLKMPRVDGLEVLRAVRADPALRTLPIVMLTSSALPEDIARCYASGANAYFVKTVDFHDFVERLELAYRFWTEVNHVSYSVS